MDKKGKVIRILKSEMQEAPLVVKNLLFCPFCFEQEISSILGEINNDGDVCITRFHGVVTKITGTSFSIVCGLCNETVFYRQEKK